MPEPFETSYLNAILNARRIYRTEALPGFTRDLYEIYGQMILDIRTDFGTGRIDGSRAIQLQRSVMARIEAMGQRLTLQMERAVLFSADLATAGHIEGLRAASQVAGVSVASNFTDVPRAALELMQARRGMGIGTTFRTLINRHIAGMQDEVVRFVQSSVGRGVSARQGSLELAALLARDDPALLEVLGNLGARGGRTRAAIEAGVKIPPVQLRQAKTLLFDAYRIQVSETNHAYFESDRLAAAVSPVVELVRWTLSGRHDGLRTSPDVCDLLAEEDAHGFGPGLYHPETVPALPHPFDQCFLESVLRRPEDWDKPKPDIPDVRRIKAARGRAILEGKKNKFSSGLTQNKIKRQTRLANESITRAAKSGGAKVRRGATIPARKPAPAKLPAPAARVPVTAGQVRVEMAARAVGHRAELAPTELFISGLDAEIKTLRLAQTTELAALRETETDLFEAIAGALEIRSAGSFAVRRQLLDLPSGTHNLRSFDPVLSASQLGKRLIDEFPELRAALDDLDEVYEIARRPLKEAIESRSAFQATLRETKARHVRDLRGLLYQDEIGTFTKKNLSKFDKARRAQYDEALVEFNRLVGNSRTPNNPIAFKAKRGGGRSYYTGLFADGGSIHMSKSAGIRTAIHEMGHWLENQFPEVQASVRAFLRKRIGNERPRKLRTITGIKGFRDNEIAWEDRFSNAYMGKVYGTDTEVLSMGLEWFYAEPLRLAVEDPDFFDFIFNLLRNRNVDDFIKLHQAGTGADPLSPFLFHPGLSPL